MQTVDLSPLDPNQLAGVDAYWRASNYLAVGQIYLTDNPLLTRSLVPGDIKPRLLGHWGTVPGLNLVYSHLNRIIRQRERELLFVAGPGHGGPAMVAQAWLEGAWTERYPSLRRDEAGMRRLFKQFSFPGGIPSHVAADVPGSIHEGGELGYSLAHAFGAVFDNPDLVAVCVVGDGEAETGPLATSWHSTKFLDPVRDGAVLPVLHLNGYKIANPTVLARIHEQDLEALFRGYGWQPYLVAGEDPAQVHQLLAGTLDRVFDEIDQIQATARSQGEGLPRPRWPLIVLRTPKGWTGPAVVDGTPVEGTWRAHQVPLSQVREDDGHREQLERWMRSYRPEELFDRVGHPVSGIDDWAPPANLRMGSSPHANGGALTWDLDLPVPADHGVQVEVRGDLVENPMRAAGAYLRDLIRANPTNFRLFGPDEVASNRLDTVYEATGKAWNAEVLDIDTNLAVDGRVMEILSEHTCEGWLEGYLLSGRHGLMSCYEAFVHIVDSMFNQHAKWLKESKEIPWRRSVPSLNYLLSSHVWRQDHNGFSHQDPGFIDHVANKKAEIVRVYLPPDVNTLLWTLDECLRTKDLVNVTIAGKQAQPGWLDVEEACLHVVRGVGIWEWASHGAEDPDVVLACAGDVPTLETLAATDLLREYLPDLRFRVVNVVDLMRLQPDTAHPHGLSDSDFDSVFTADRPIIFAFHGYPALIHRLTYNRAVHEHLHVRGYLEEGTTTTPFDMLVRNDMDRFHLVIDVIDRVPGLAERHAVVRERMVDARTRHRAYVTAYGDDLPEVKEWQFRQGTVAKRMPSSELG